MLQGGSHHRANQVSYAFAFALAFALAYALAFAFAHGVADAKSHSFADNGPHSIANNIAESLAKSLANDIADQRTQQHPYTPSQQERGNVDGDGGGGRAVGDHYVDGLPGQHELLPRGLHTRTHARTMEGRKESAQTGV